VSGAVLKKLEKRITPRGGGGGECDLGQSIDRALVKERELRGGRNTALQEGGPS